MKLFATIIFCLCLYWRIDAQKVDTSYIDKIKVPDKISVLLNLPNAFEVVSFVGTFTTKGGSFLSKHHGDIIDGKFKHLIEPANAGDAITLSEIVVIKGEKQMKWTSKTFVFM